MSLLVVASLPLGLSVVDLIRAGEAGRAYVRLTEELDDELEIARPRRDHPTVVAEADLLRYLRCLGPDPTAKPKGPGPLGWQQAQQMLGAERLRLARHRREGRASGPEAWLADDRLSWRAPGGATPPRMIRWPAESERWSDEQPVVALPEVRCPPDPGPPARRKPRELLLDEAEAMRSLRLALPAGFPVRAALLLDEAVLRARLDDWPEVWVLVRLLDAEAALPGAGPLAAREQAEYAILSGLAAEHDQRDEEALKRWTRAGELPLSRAEKLFVDVRRQRLLVQLGQLREARALLDGYTNLPGEVGRYLRYRNALVRFQTGDEGALLAMARELLGRRPAAQNAVDPIARASEELVYLQLARHPFSLEQIEVVESIGPVGELSLRMEALAATALEHGRPQLASDLFHWLIEKRPTGYARPFYLGRLAVAAAALDDAAGFASSFSALIEEALAAAAPKAKGGKPRRRSIEWDRQILLTTRDAVTPLVARKSYAPLKLLTAELQKYLRASKAPYPELQELYRLASTQLPASPRGYAEKIGAERAPVWLGEVTLDRPRRLVPDPDLAVPELAGPLTLLCLPDGVGGCPRWLGPPERARPRREQANAR